MQSKRVSDENNVNAPLIAAENEPVNAGNTATHPATQCCIKVNGVFDAIHDAADALASAYGIFAPYASLVHNKAYNAVYFVPAGVPLLTRGLTLLPFSAATKTKILHGLETTLHVVLNSSFVSSFGQTILNIFAKELRPVTYYTITGVMTVALTIAFARLAVLDLKLRDENEEHDFSPFTVALIKYLARPLQTAASLEFFLRIFSEHAHVAPEWMPTAVGGGLGLSRLAYEIASGCSPKVKEWDRFIDKALHDGLFTSLQTSSVLLTVTNSLMTNCVKQSDGENKCSVSNAAFIAIVLLAFLLFILTLIGKMVHYLNDVNNRDGRQYISDDDNDHNDNSENRAPTSKALKSIVEALDEEKEPLIEASANNNNDDVSPRSPTLRKLSLFKAADEVNAVEELKKIAEAIAAPQGF